MGVRETHALPGQSIQAGRLEGRVLAIARGLSITDVVEQDENYVGLGSSSAQRKSEQRSAQRVRDAFFIGEFLFRLLVPKPVWVVQALHLGE